MPTTYRIARGDTLGKLAARFYGSPAKYTLIVTANQITNPDKLRIGQLLVIPDPQATPTNGARLAPVSLNEKRLAQLHPVAVHLRSHAGHLPEARGWRGIRAALDQDPLGRPRHLRPHLRTR